MKKMKGVRNLKRVIYKGRATKFRGFIALMTVVGLISSLGYFLYYAYNGYAAAKADVVLNYPEIAQSRRPDGSRFTYYDLISDENIAAALDIMNSNDKYKNFTVSDLRNSFDISSYLENSAGDTVSTVRSEGNDFSYVANEYRITFTQPHDYKNKNFIRKFIGKDYSRDFLRALLEVNRVRLAEEQGGIDGFKNLTEIKGADNYDYSEKLRVYRTKIKTIALYLDYLNRRSPDFVSFDNYTLKDLQGKYEFLISNRIDGISDFIKSSGISKDVDQASNKLNVHIEYYSLRCNKHSDRSQINQFAMTNYDQTFTENLINVIQNKTYGLYQARPKTAFDTVVDQKHNADTNLAEYSAMVSQFQTELQTYAAVEQTPDETGRLNEKCEELIDEFEDEYKELTRTARVVVEEYFNSVNEEYLTANISRMNLITPSLLVRLGLVFALGAVLAFIAAVFISSVSDSRKLRRKKKLIDDIKETTVREEA